MNWTPIRQHNSGLFFLVSFYRGHFASCLSAQHHSTQWHSTSIILLSDILPASFSLMFWLVSFYNQSTECHSIISLLSVILQSVYWVSFYKQSSDCHSTISLLSVILQSVDWVSFYNQFLCVILQSTECHSSNSLLSVILLSTECHSTNSLLSVILLSTECYSTNSLLSFILQSVYWVSFYNQSTECHSITFHFVKCHTAGSAQRS